MGFLNFFSRSARRRPAPPGSGSVTVDRDGTVMTSTLPHQFPARGLREIVHRVLAAFRAAREARMPLREIAVQYTSCKLLAREQRGGAIIFLSSPAPSDPLKSAPSALRP